MNFRITTTFFLLTIVLLCPISAALSAPIFLPISDRKDMVYDDSRQMLYITTSTSLVRYNVATQQYLPPIAFSGGNLRGIDISPDHSKLVIADQTRLNGQTWLHTLDLATEQINKVTFNAVEGESGTYMAVYGSDGKIILSSNFRLGEGFYDAIRKYDPILGTTQSYSFDDPLAMLAVSADRNFVAGVNKGLSFTQQSKYNVATGVLSGNWIYSGAFPYEVGVSPDGLQFAIANSDGIFVVNNSSLQLKRLPRASGVVYSPVHDVLYTTEFSSGGPLRRSVYAYSTNTFQEIAVYDAYGSATGSFNGTSNTAFVEGRLRISQDGNLLFATIDGGVSIIAVPEPSMWLSMLFVTFSIFTYVKIRKDQCIITL